MKTPSYLLDTNCCIYLIKGSDPVLEARVGGLSLGAAALSAIVHAELCFGLPQLGSRGEEVLRRLARAFPILPFDQAASAAAVRVPFRRGRLDRLIAAHALSLGVTLITNNERDFSGIAGLKVENWTQS